MGRRLLTAISNLLVHLPRLAGLKRTGEGPWAYRPTWLFYAYLACALVFLGGSTFAFLYTSRPVFCSSCHNIRPYYESWKRSAHHKVPCTKCHFEPGTLNYIKRKCLAVSEVVQYVTKTFEPRPRSRIPDACCLRSGCHTRAALASEKSIEVARSRRTTMKIRFNHKKHFQQIGDKKLRCVSCHLQVTQDVHFQVRAGVCFLCHLRGSRAPGVKAPRFTGRDKACTVCHDAPVGTIRLATGTYNHAEYVGKGADCRSCHQDTIRGSGAVHVENCLHCHGDPEKLRHREDPARLHATHVAGHEAECFDCHFPIEHGLPEEHSVHVADCRSCHQVSHEAVAFLYRGRGGRGVSSMPSPMYRANVDCQGCHRTEQSQPLAEGVRPSQGSCRACHGGKYKGRLAEWRRSSGSLLKETLTRLVESEQACSTLTGEARKRAEKLLGDARYNIAFVRQAQPLHNINYATALLNAAKTYLREARGLIAYNEGKERGERRSE